MTTERNVSRAATSYRNGVLTVICGLLVLLCVRELGVGDSAALASSATESVGPPNAAAQRLQMIQELRELRAISTKLGSIEKTIDSRLSAVEQRLTEQTALLKASERRRGRSEETQ